MKHFSEPKIFARLLAGSVLLWSAAATAQQGQLLNLSANSEISSASDTRFITCTVVTGFISVVVFAEARPESRGLDPSIRVFRLVNDFTIAENDDFLASPESTRQLIIDSVGRAPTSGTDAAVIITKNDETTDSICVEAEEVTSGGGVVNVQIQQVPFVRLNSANGSRSAGSDAADYQTF